LRRIVAGVGETITTAPRLEAVVESASRHARVAVDLESNGFHRYPERVCLVQLAAGDAVYFIDPLSIEDVSPLGRLLADASVEKVFHSADYDIRSLGRDWGFRVRGLFDTSIAAAFTGSERLGLGAVLKEHVNVDIPKSKKLQRADWTIRPLSDEMLRYAAEDVLHLARLRTVLHRKLDKLGRAAWVEEETERLAAVRHSAPDVEWGFLSTKGSRDLDDRGLAVLRALHGFREKEARRRDRPPFKIISDAVIVALASEPSSDLARVKGIGPYGRARNSSGLRRAIREGLAAAPVKRPRPQRSGKSRLSRQEREAAPKRLRLLKQWRLEHASRLKLDPGMLWPAASLERLSLRPGELDDELQSAEVRRWQRQELGQSLREFAERP
jgi:ribonuclease D